MDAKAMARRRQRPVRRPEEAWLSDNAAFTRLALTARKYRDLCSRTRVSVPTVGCGNRAVMASRVRFGLAGSMVCGLLTVVAAPANAQNLFQELFGSIARVFSAPNPRPDPMDTLARTPDGVISQRQDSAPA